MGRQEQLEFILAESIASARERERNAFDEFASPHQQAIVLYGAGNLGRKVLRGLRANGIEPLAFADANAALWEKQVEGVTVYSPAEAVRSLGDSAVFVVCVWHPDREGVHDIVDRLSTLGARRATSFVPLFWKFPEAFLPYYLWDLPSRLLEQSAAIRAAYAAFEDESSARFVRELRFRLHADFCQMRGLAEVPQYFPRELFQARRDECFVDCGAYDGDTIRGLLAETGGEFRKVIAFEPDHGNCEKLRRYLAGQVMLAARISIHEAAVARTPGILRFAATAASDAAVSLSGDTIVTCTSLDSVLAGESPTYIKMDIEGSELEALEGAANVIGAHQPLLAVCVYHVPDHLWAVPLWLRKTQPEAKLFLRSYAADGWESVCYAVPPGRCPAAGSNA